MEGLEIIKEITLQQAEDVERMAGKLRTTLIGGNGTTGQYSGGRPSSSEQRGTPTRREEDTKGPRTLQRGSKRSCGIGKPERSTRGC